MRCTSREQTLFAGKKLRTEGRSRTGGTQVPGFETGVFMVFGVGLVRACDVEVSFAGSNAVDLRTHSGLSWIECRVG